MDRPASPILTRLRAHCGLWLVCLVTLLFKLVAGSVCMANDGLASASDASASVVQTVASANAAHVPGDAGGCALGEVGGCHCACAHSVPVPPIAGVAERIAIITTLDWPLSSPQSAPAHTGSLLRPPIV